MRRQTVALNQPDKIYTVNKLNNDGPITNATSKISEQRPKKHVRSKRETSQYFVSRVWSDKIMSTTNVVPTKMLKLQVAVVTADHLVFKNSPTEIMNN